MFSFVLPKHKDKNNMVCSFSKEFSAAANVSVENGFILEYMPEATGEAVKVYLYGLYLCFNPSLDKSVKDIAETLSLSEETVKDCFTYWEEFGLLSVVEKEPFTVKYLPVRAASYSKPRRYKPEKYADFTKGIQALLPDRMISTGEYTEYFDVMESYGIKPEAMLMIVKYCTDRKGSDVSYRYISKVAKDFGNRGITTVEKVEKELSSYILRTGELLKIFSALSINRTPDIEDSNLFKKWTRELSFDPDAVVYAAERLKKGSMAKLDALINELYSMKCFSKEEIAAFFDKKKEAEDAAKDIARALSVYVAVVDPVVDTYVSKWFSYGFSAETLKLIASRCFILDKKSFAEMDEMVEKMRKEGVIDLAAVQDCFDREKKSDKFIKKMLVICGISRRPTPWDRDNLAMWKSWNFSEDMILEAAKIASGKNSPVAYMNGVLSNWKNKGVYSVNELADSEKADSGEVSIEEYNREYERRRAIAVSRAQKNLETAMNIRGFKDIYERIFSIEKDLAFAEISGNKEALASLEKEQKNLNEKAEKLLSPKGLSFTDLSPRYACEKCNDTGYVGTHRCDCFDKKI